MNFIEAAKLRISPIEKQKETMLIHLWNFKGKNIAFPTGKPNIFTLRNPLSIKAKIRMGGKVKFEKT